MILVPDIFQPGGLSVTRFCIQNLGERLSQHEVVHELLTHAAVGVLGKTKPATGRALEGNTTQEACKDA